MAEDWRSEVIEEVFLVKRLRDNDDLASSCGERYKLNRFKRCRDNQSGVMSGMWMNTSLFMSHLQTITVWHTFIRQPDMKNWLIGKGPNVGKDWRPKEKGVAEDKMVEQHHWLSGHEFEQTLGDSARRRSLVHCGLWGCKESDTTED